MINIKEFQFLCHTVVLAAPDSYAKAYARAGMNMHTEDAMSAQISYILSNLGHWRGEEARATKLAFKNL